MRYLTLLVSLILVLAACGDEDSPAVPSTVLETTTTTTTSASSQTTSSSADTPAPTTTATTSTTTLPPRSLDDVTLDFVEAGFGFTAPVLMITPPGEDDRRFVVDQPGVIVVIGDGDPEFFVDITDRVRYQGEQGLLGLAFHPDFATNNLLYVDYVNNDGDTVIASLQAEGNTAAVDTLTEILVIDQPAGNHNGGMIQFGPDGNLWIGMGDGGGANDQFGNGQREDTLLGAMLRITVGPGIDGYEIPDGNLADEIWAIGLRNPWRWTFDGNDLWIADVGQNRIEEVNVVDWRDGPRNFGWPIQEGSSCFGGDDCDKTGLVQPIYEYSHSEGCSITGGFVYRGDSVPELAGSFFFADYCSGWVRSIDKDGDVREWFPAGTFSGMIGFGVDESGEIYMGTSGGSLYRLIEAVD